MLAGAKRHDSQQKLLIAKWEESEHDGPSHSKGIKGPHVPLATSGLPCFACAGLAEEKRAAPCEKRSVEQRLASDMRVMEPYWMRQPNRSIMTVKWAPLTAMGGVCPLLDIKAEYMKVGRGTHDFVLTVPEIPPGEMQTFGSDVIPASMRKAGVRKLTWATLLMHRSAPVLCTRALHLLCTPCAAPCAACCTSALHRSSARDLAGSPSTPLAPSLTPRTCSHRDDRPWCMWRASTHSEAEESSCRGSSCRGATLARGSTDKDIGQWARRELMHIEELVLQHQKLVQRGAAVLVVNLAHLVFDFKGFDSRLRAFAPCLGGKLDDAFEPQLGTDVFLSNQLKTGGSIQEYARAHKPHNWMLDEKLACREPPEKLFEGLNETEMVRQHGGSPSPLPPSSQPHSRPPLTPLGLLAPRLRLPPSPRRFAPRPRRSISWQWPRRIRSAGGRRRRRWTRRASRGSKRRRRFWMPFRRCTTARSRRRRRPRRRGPRRRRSARRRRRAKPRSTRPK